jgi:hypothetical protein
VNANLSATPTLKLDKALATVDEIFSGFDKQHDHDEKKQKKAGNLKDLFHNIIFSDYSKVSNSKQNIEV